MRKQIVEGLSALNLEIVRVNNRFSRVLNGTRRQNSLLHEYFNHIIEWVTEWHDRFSRDVLNASSASKLKSIYERKSLELRAYFFMRHAALPFVLADFTEIPFLGIHDSLVAAVKLIVKEDESVCQIMMPWVERVVGYADERDIKSATEDLEGDFVISGFVTAEDDQSTLISVMDYLDYVRASNDIAKRFFVSTHPAMLERKLGVPLRNYVRSLEYRYRKTTMDRSCFAYHMHHLAISLHERSKNREGSDLVAAEAYESVIVDFYSIWKTLSSKDRKMIAALKTSAGEKYTLEDYLLVAFASVPSIQARLSIDELKRERKNNIINCANVLSFVLLLFLREHLDGWSKLVVDAVSSTVEEVVYTDAKIDAFRNDLLTTISTSSRRLSHLKECLVMASNEKYKDDFQRFFASSKLLFSITDSVFEYFFADFKNKITNAQDVFSFFSKLNNKYHATEFWCIYQNEWKKWFTDIEDIIKLTHFLNEDGVDHVLNCFKETLFTHYRATHFHYPDDANLGVAFMLSATKKMPGLVKNVRFLVNCILLCKTKGELDLFFSRISGHLESLFFINEQVMASRWTIFIDMLSSRLSDRTFNHLDKKMIYTLSIEYLLPIFLRKDQIEQYWESSFSSCWSSFFCFSRIHEKDRLAYNGLQGIYVEAGSKLDLKSLVQLVDLLFDFVEKNEGGRFLKTIKATFRADFFQKTKEMLAIFRYAPVPVFSPRSMVEL